MYNNINEILKTDKRARERLEKARYYALNRRKKLELEIEKTKEDVEIKAQEAKEELKFKEARKISSSSEKIAIDTERIIKTLDEKYEENHDKWVKQIVMRVLSDEVE